MTVAVEHAPDVPSGPPHYRILLIEDDLGGALLVEELLHDAGLGFELTTRTTLTDRTVRYAVHRSQTEHANAEARPNTRTPKPRQVSHHLRQRPQTDPDTP